MIVTFGQLRVIGTGPELLLPLLLSLIEDTVAVLLIAGQLATDVVASSIMVFEVPAAIVPKLQVSVLPPAAANGCVELHAGAALAPLTVHVSPLFGRTSVKTTWNEEAGPFAVTLIS